MFSSDRDRQQLEEILNRTISDKVGKTWVVIRGFYIFIGVLLSVNGEKLIKQDPYFSDFIISRVRRSVTYLLGSNQNKNRYYKYIYIQLFKKNDRKNNQENNNVSIFETGIHLNETVELDPKDLIWIFNKRVDVLIEEYKTLRQEILGIQSSLTNIFNYGLVFLGVAFAGIQSILSQINKEISSEHYNQLLSLLSILLLLFVPFICVVFSLKWVSGARAVGYIGSYLVRIELEVNRSFNKFTNSESDNYFFGDYELQIDWESNLRRVRKLSGKPNVVFGSLNIFIVMTFFFLIGIISQVLSGIIIEPSFLGNKFHWMFLICLSLYFIFWGVIADQFLLVRKWYLALPFDIQSSLNERSISYKFFFDWISFLSLLCRWMIKYIFPVIIATIIYLVFLFNNANPELQKLRIKPPDKLQASQVQQPKIDKHSDSSQKIDRGSLKFPE